MSDVASLRTRTTQTFKARGGSYAVRVSSGESLNYRDALGRWQPIDNRLTIDGDHLRNGANRYSVLIPRQLGSEAIRASDGDAWIEFAPQGASGRTASLRGSEATFASVSPGVELRHAATADSAKEALVVRDLASVRDFVFDLSVPPGYTPVADRFGAVSVRDAKGVTRLQLSRSTMIDAAGAISSSASQLRRGRRGWELVQIPDRKWLSDPSRKWPVTIDPTVSMPSADLGCWIYRPTTGPNCLNGAAGLFLSQAPDELHDSFRALVHFDLDGALPPGAVVEYAALDPHATLEDLPREDIAVYEMTESWDENVDWYTRDRSTAWAGDPLVGGASSSVTGPYTAASGGQTDMVRRWVSGEDPNYGVQLRKIGDESEYTTVSLTLAIQYAPTDDPDGLQAFAADSYASAAGITVEEAMRRLRIQDRLNDAVSDIVDAIDEHKFAGIWIDDNDAGRPKIGIESTMVTPPTTATSDAEEVLEDHNLEAEVDFVSVASSMDDLEDAQADLSTDIHDLVIANKVAIGITTKVNSVSVITANSLTPTEQTELSAALAGLSVATTTEPVDAATLGGEDAANDCVGLGESFGCSGQLRGGMTLLRYTDADEDKDPFPNCTLGLHAHGNGADRNVDHHYLLTAGHCFQHSQPSQIRGAFYDTGADRTIGFDVDHEVGPNDAGLVYVDHTEDSYNANPEPWVFMDKSNANDVSSPRRDRYVIKRVSTVPRKQVSETQICVSSGFRLTSTHFAECGYLSRVPFEQGNLKALARVNFCVINGASGGPVYKNNIAYGLWTGHYNDLHTDNGCGYGWFQSLTKAAEAMKVVVDTSAN